MHIIKPDIAIGELHLNVLSIKDIVRNMEIGRQALKRETAVLVKRQALDTDVKVVVFQSRQGEVGAQVVDRQMVGVEAPRMARLVQHVIGER